MTIYGGPPCFIGGVPANGGGGDVCSLVGFDAIRDINDTISTAGTGYKLNWTVKTADPGGDFNLTTDQFTAPVDGAYTFTCNGKFTTAAAGLIYLSLYLNGTSSTGTLITEQTGRAPFASEIACNVARVIYLSAGDYVQAWVSQTTAQPMTFQGCGNHFSCRLICAGTI